MCVCGVCVCVGGGGGEGERGVGELGWIVSAYTTHIANIHLKQSQRSPGKPFSSIQNWKESRHCLHKAPRCCQSLFLSDQTPIFKMVDDTTQ